MAIGNIVILTNPRINGLVRLASDAETPNNCCERLSDEQGVPGRYEVATFRLVNELDQVIENM